MPVCPFVGGTGGDCYAKSRQALQQHLKKQHQCDLVNDDGNDWAVFTSPDGSVLKQKVQYKPYPPEKCQDSATVSTVGASDGLTAMETSSDSVPGEHCSYHAVTDQI